FVPLAGHLDGIELVAVDLPGHGRSAHLPPGADYSFAGALHAVLDIADALDWERFALLGHSMGAGIASLLAAACPGRVTRLVAIEALGALPDSEDNTVPRLREAIDAGRALGGKRMRMFEELETPVRARTLARTGAIGEAAARLLVERGVREVVADDGRRGWVWSSDPRLTLPTLVRMTPGQVQALIHGSPTCPSRDAANTRRCCPMASCRCCPAATTCTWNSPPRWPRRSATSCGRMATLPDAEASGTRLLARTLQLHADDHVLVAVVAVERQRGVAALLVLALLEGQDRGVGRMLGRHRLRPALRLHRLARGGEQAGHLPGCGEADHADALQVHHAVDLVIGGQVDVVREIVG